MSHEETNLRAAARSMSDRLAGFRDELRVRGHLLTMDAKDAWSSIEPEFHAAERALRRVLDATVPGGSEQARLELRLGLAEAKSKIEAIEPRFEKLGHELAGRGRALLTEVREHVTEALTHG